MLRLFDAACRRGLRGHGQRFSLDAKVAIGGKQLVDGYREGQTIHGFRVNQVTDVEELHLTAVRLEHLATAAQYLHLQRDDANNVFAVGFRTTPTDSTGLPHILEHTTLCGSEKFPCRDPFFKMLRRSLATFMNAMTGPDYTVYPFSTQNLKDYKNLQSVYLDSVFRPNLRLLDFRQEGWRLEHADVHDKTSPVVFKGVVFNEMKGAFSENQSIFSERILNSILPSHTYAVISGGDPLVIPQLTHQDLVNFHATYYHPSNARFFSYGNFPLEDHLKIVNDQYLAQSGRVDASATRVPPEKRWDRPRTEHIQCRPDPMASDPEKQSSIAVGFLCSDITDVQETFEMQVLAQLLLRGPTSAFYKSLVEPNIGAGFSPVTGYDAHSRDTTFVVGLQGVSPKDFSKVEGIVGDTIDRVLKDGFEESHIEAVLHGIELGVKHQTSNFGLNLILGLTPLWNHEGDIVQAMKVNKAVKTLRESLERNPRHLCDLVSKYLKNNNHRLTLTMSPDESYEEKKNAAERAILAEKLERLSPEDFEKIFADGQALLAEQEKKEDPGVLPSLKIDDLENDVHRVQLTDLAVAGVPLQLAVQPTNDVTYYRGILSVEGLDDELKDLVPLFNTIVGKMGTANYDYRTFDRLTQLKTGGLSLSNHIAETKDNALKYEEGVIIQSYCLDRNSADMWNLWGELFNNVDLTDSKRFETLVKVTAANLANGIADSGHIYALCSSASLVSPAAKRRENLSGLEFVGKMKRIAQSKDLSPVMVQMQQIAKLLLSKNRLRSALNLSPDSKDHTLREIEEFYNVIHGQAPLEDRLQLITKGEAVGLENRGVHHVLPFPVNYASKSILTVPYADPRYAALRILSKLITSIYLHPEVREKGGAYGGGAKLSSDGVFSFFSYRDPNSIRTLDVFDGTYEFLKNNGFAQEEIDEAKLGVFQQIDSPVPPGNRGMTKFIHDISDDELQRHRMHLKNVTSEQLMTVAEEFLKPDQKGIPVGRSLIGGPNPKLSERPEKWTVVSNQEEESAAQPPAAEDYYYFRCKTKKEFIITDSVLEKLCPRLDPEEIVCVPPIHYRYNFHEGPLPHVAVAVEEIPTYFTKTNSQSCVPTIRTLGIVRRLEHEFYALESINEFVEPVQILLTRGTNRPVKGFRTYRWARRMNKKRKKRVKGTNVRKITGRTDKPKDSRGNIKIKGLPFPDSVRDPLSLGDTRAIDGGIYVVLGRLQWANDQPIIDVHKFIPVDDYESTYQSFVLQHATARRRIAHYQAHPAEIGKVVRRPYEHRNLTFLPPVRKRNGKGSKMKTKTESTSGSGTQNASDTKKYIRVIDINVLRDPRFTNISS